MKLATILTLSESAAGKHITRFKKKKLICFSIYEEWPILWRINCLGKTKNRNQFQIDKSVSDAGILSSIEI